jgi:hypothetical protein
MTSPHVRRLVILLLLALAAPAAAGQRNASQPPDGAKILEAAFPAPGTAWTLVVEHSGMPFRVRREVLPDDVWRGRKVHRVRVQPPQGEPTVELFDLETCNYIASLRDGRLVDQRMLHPHNALFSWPLWPGKTWRRTVELSDAHRDRWPYPVVGEAEGFENVTVPAGTFRALKLVAGDPTRGLWNETLWYDPDSRLVVKRKTKRFQQGQAVRKLFAYDPPEPDEDLLARNRSQTRPASEAPKPAVVAGPEEPTVKLKQPAPQTPPPEQPEDPRQLRPETEVEVSESRASELPEALLQLQERILARGGSPPEKTKTQQPNASRRQPASESGAMAVKSPKSPAPPSTPASGAAQQSKDLPPVDQPAAPLLQKSRSAGPQAPQNPRPPAQHRLAKLTPAQKDDAFTLDIQAAGAVGGYKGTFGRDPYRVILDLKGRWTYDGPDAIKLEQGMVEEIRVGRHPDKLRLVLDMAGDAPVIPSVQRRSDGLLLTIKPK